MGRVDLSIPQRTLRYSRADFIAVAATASLTPGLGFELGVVASGTGISVLRRLYRTLCPHVAKVGLVPGTRHSCNIDRYDVRTGGRLLTLPTMNACIS